MSSVMPDNLRAQQQYPGGDWRSGYQSLPVRRDGSTLPRDLVVAGLVVAGLGLLAWHYLGPDLRRYLKMTNM
jgi:hypothetical protein